MPIPKAKNLSKFFADPDWVIVEGILKDCLSQLSYAPTEDTEPADFKAQIIANKKLKDAVNKFLSEADIITKPIESSNPWE